MFAMSAIKDLLARESQTQSSITQGTLRGAEY